MRPHTRTCDPIVMRRKRIQHKTTAILLSLHFFPHSGQRRIGVLLQQQCFPFPPHVASGSHKAIPLFCPNHGTIHQCYLSSPNQGTIFVSFFQIQSVALVQPTPIIAPRGPPPPLFYTLCNGENRRKRSTSASVFGSLSPGQTTAT